MSHLEDKLRLHLADKRPIWSSTWERAVAGATWDEAGSRRLLLAVDGPIVAARVVDAYVQGLDAVAAVTLAHHAKPTPVAIEAAARLGVTLLDASHLPPPPPSYDVPDDLLTRFWADAAEADAAPLIDVGSGVLDEELLGEVDGLVAALEDEPLLPWSGPALPEPEPSAHVDPLEVMAMPWHHPDHADASEHLEVLPGNARPTVPHLRPTQAPDWGLPWPRPLPPTDASISRAEPALWGVRERVRAVHDQTSAWLRRVQQGL